MAYNIDSLIYLFVSACMSVYMSVHNIRINML